MPRSKSAPAKRTPLELNRALQLPAKPPALPTPAADFVRPTLRTKKVLTVPIISMSHRDMLVCRCLEEPHQSDISLGDDTKDKPVVCLVQDLDTGAVNLLICHTLLISAWEKAGGTVTGRIFKVIAGEMKQGKNNKYRDLTVSEEEEI